MALPELFRFSQNSLQDYADCPRRFELKYIFRQDWPAAVSEPIMEFELHQKLGNQFHLLVQRHLAGIAEKILNGSLPDTLLEQWWKNYLTFIKQFDLNKCKAEQIFSIPFGQDRLIAKYDCIITGENHLTIIDWKTSRFRTPGKVLRSKLQSMVYPYVLFASNPEKYSAEKIHLVYWFPEFPNDPEEMIFSQEDLIEIKPHIQELIDSIKNTQIGSFALMENNKLCKFCTFRSLCNRGAKAGFQTIEENDPDDEESSAAIIDFNSIEEFQF